jgi:hypothetical protein
MGGSEGPVAFEVDIGIDTTTRVHQGLQAHAAGDNDTARERLDPVVDDPLRWQLVAASGVAPVEVAYIAGILRLEAGDPDGASRILRLVVGPQADDRVRRALAQVELARGELGEAERLLDTSPKAALMDQALVVTLRWRQGRVDDAVRLAAELVDAKPRRQQRRQHPWTVAGALAQAGFVAADAGVPDLLDRALARIMGLIHGAPTELPLVTQGAILAASMGRLRGDLDGAQHLVDIATARVDPGTCDLGLAQVEHARILVARGDAAGAAAAFATAAATLDTAGERWLAGRTRQEAAAFGTAG